MAKGRYEELAKSKAKNGEVEAITVRFVKMKDKGETICGKLLNVAPVRGKDSGKIYHNYLIETDGGLVKTAFGGAYDTEMLGLIFIGGVYLWTYQGEEKISNGHTMRRYDTTQIDLEEREGTALECSRSAIVSSEV